MVKRWSKNEKRLLTKLRVFFLTWFLESRQSPGDLFPPFDRWQAHTEERLQLNVKHTVIVLFSSDQAVDYWVSTLDYVKVGTIG